VADGDALQRRVGDSLLVLLDELDDDVGPGTDAALVLTARLRVAVEILAADRHANDEVGELVAVRVDGLLQGAELLVDVVGARGPDAEQQLGLGVDGGLEGLDGVVLRVGLDVGVQAHGVEGAGSVLEALGSLELGFEVGLELGRAVGEGGARVEAEIVLGRRTRGEGAGGDESGGGTHGG
jgi:hypothetical protein